MGFLTEHARLAWKAAVHNCRLIIDGLVDLEQRKIFVSSFQNATELCLKQYLIDKNNIAVLNNRMQNSRDPNTVLIYNNCSTSHDYNAFFSGLSSADLEKIISSDFGYIVNVVFNASNSLTPYVSAITNVMQRCRNTETHFFIDEESYLPIDDFKELCRLMITLQAFFRDEGILDNSSESTDERSVKYLGYFDVDFRKIKSYRGLVIGSKTNKVFIRRFLEPFEPKSDFPRGWMFYVKDSADLYSVAHEMYEHHGIDDSDCICFDFKFSLQEFYRRLLLWIKYGMISIDYYDDCYKGEKINVVFVYQSKKMTTYLKKNP